ncbi:MAG: hypothetical protein ACLPXB_06980, partial [Thiobacillaceae bacterium]
TRYQPMQPGLKGVEEGYVEQRMPDGSLRLTYSTAAPTSEKEALGLWHRRAKELCGSSEYEADPQVDLRARTVYVAPAYMPETLYSPLIQGTLKCGKHPGGPPKITLDWTPSNPVLVGVFIAVGAVRNGVT